MRKNIGIKFRKLFGMVTLFLIFLLVHVHHVSAASSYFKSFSSQYKSSIYYQNLKNVSLTGDCRKDIVAVAESQIGYTEGNSSSQINGSGSGNGNYTEYGKYLGSNGRPWCSEFVSWCARNADVPTSILENSRSANVKTFAAPYYKWSQTIYAGGSYTIKPGDILLFAWNGTSVSASDLSHTALVYSVSQEGNSVLITVIHGNSSDMVQKSTYTINASSGTLSKGTLVYIISPNYPKKLTISKLKNTSSGISLTWNKVKGCSGYYIYRKSNSGSFKKIAKITNSTTHKYKDTAVQNKNGKTYTYKVCPYYKNSSGDIIRGKGSSRTIIRLTSIKITSVKKTSSTKIKVKWKKKNNINGYEIQYSTSKNFTKNKLSTFVPKASLTGKTISGLTKGTPYYVRIRTYKTVNGITYYSAWSSKKKIK